jgi:glycosyltransferase involved in cell wall biosynthesis
MPQLLKRHPEALLIYAGDGEEKDYLQNIIAQRQLQKHIRLLGAVPHAHMQKYYAASDVVLIPSVHSAGVEEATSIAALEAMGSKTPVVASAVGGLKEIIDHKKTGLLVEEKNIPDLVEAVDKLLRDRTFSESLADCARQKIEAEFSHIRCAQKYAAIYQSALERPAATF